MVLGSNPPELLSENPHIHLSCAPTSTTGDTAVFQLVERFLSPRHMHCFLMLMQGSQLKSGFASVNTVTRNPPEDITVSLKYPAYFKNSNRSLPLLGSISRHWTL